MQITRVVRVIIHNHAHRTRTRTQREGRFLATRASQFVSPVSPWFHANGSARKSSRGRTLRCIGKWSNFLLAYFFAFYLLFHMYRWWAQRLPRQKNTIIKMIIAISKICVRQVHVLFDGSTLISCMGQKVLIIINAHIWRLGNIFYFTWTYIDTFKQKWTKWYNTKHRVLLNSYDVASQLTYLTWKIVISDWF